MRYYQLAIFSVLHLTCVLQRVLTRSGLLPFPDVMHLSPRINSPACAGGIPTRMGSMFAATVRSRSASKPCKLAERDSCHQPNQRARPAII